MKYCPKCGAPLDDHLKFCTKCGAPQPTEEVKQEEKKAEPVPEVKSEERPLSDRERFNNLLNTDQRFKNIVKASKLAALFTLVNLLFLIPFFVGMFTKVGAFTGVDVSAQGASYFDVLGIHYFPYGYSAMSIRKFIAYAKAGHWSICPNDTLRSPTTVIIFIFGLIFAALLVVISVVGRPNGYLLKTYEKENGEKELIKSIKSPMTLLAGVFLTIVGIMPGIATYIASTDLKYESGHHYVFGQVTGLSSGLITIIVVAVIFIGLILGGNIVLRVVFVNKLLNANTEQK